MQSIQAVSQVIEVIGVTGVTGVIGVIGVIDAIEFTEVIGVVARNILTCDHVTLNSLKILDFVFTILDKTSSDKKKPFMPVQ